MKILNRYTGEIIFDADISLPRWKLEMKNTASVNLSAADLSHLDLRDIRLPGAKLCGADLRFAHLYSADLRRADLRDADLRDANLCWADLCGADLRGADLREAYMDRSLTCNANFDGAKITCGDRTVEVGYKDLGPIPKPAKELDGYTTIKTSGGN